MGASIRGKDLIGGIKVMPMGLDAAIKKRTSGEFKSEKSGGSLSFSNANQEQKMESFKEESSGFNQVSSLKSASKQSSSVQSSSLQSSSMQSSTKQSSSFQSSSSSSKQMSSSNQVIAPNQMASSNQVASSNQMSSSNQMAASSQMSSSAMSMSSQKSMSSMTSSKSVASSGSNAVSFQSSGLVQQEVEQSLGAVTMPMVHNQEIQQEVLKTQIVSAITDLEGDREFVDFGRENKPIDLTSPPKNIL